MELVNIHELETVYGQKTIELYHGDLTNMGFPVDCLVASAFRGGYIPRKNTLLGDLYEHHGILAGDLLKDAELDLIKPLNVWISRELSDSGFKRIAFVELLGTGQSFEFSIRNLFGLIRICEAYDIKIDSMAMPVLGTGNQMIPVREIMPVLLEHATKALKQITQLRRIIFVEKNKRKLNFLDRSMNRYLRRVPANLKSLPDTAYSQKIIDDLKHNLIRLRALLPPEQSSTVNDLFNKLISDNSRMFEIGILGRKLIEIMVRDILQQQFYFEELAKTITRLQEKSIAMWIISYLHLIRVFGNISAHSSDANPTKPREMNENDFDYLLFCLNRVTDFWYSYKMERGDKC